MVVSEQLAAFNAFAVDVLQREGSDHITLDEVYDRWVAERRRDDDLEAIRRSAADYDRGERGEPARQELADHRTERAASGPS